MTNAEKRLAAISEALDLHDGAAAAALARDPVELDADVRRLVIAAREVAFGECRDFGDERFAELDAASEAFADRVPWDDAPTPGTTQEPR